MEGKIFPDSANIWQDQAKILFNYYRQAAERVVTEEERIEHEIAQLEEEKAHIQKEISGLWIWFLTIILFFVYFIKKNNYEKQIAAIDARILEFQNQWQQIFRNYRVKRLGVAYVPVAEQIQYQDKSFIVDYTSSVPEQEISMSMSRRNDLLVETIRNLEQLSKEAPIVETSEESETIATDDYSLSIQEVHENDYLGALERSLRTVTYCMDDLDTTSVTLPVVLDGNPFLGQLNTFGTTNPPAEAPVLEVFDSAQYAPAIEKFAEINRLKSSLSDETGRFEEVLRQLMQTIAKSVQSLSSLKIASVDKVVLESNKLLYQILKAPYNHYSPVLEIDEIERIRNERFDFSDDVQGYVPFQLRSSSRVRFNPVSGTWVAEDGSQTVVPFGVHQLYEEIVAPMVQSLMEENRLKRLDIYNAIQDQKVSYLNKWHQDTDSFYRDNRAQAQDILNLMQDALTKYVAAYNTLVSLQRTEELMQQSGSQDLDSAMVKNIGNSAESLAAFELQGQEFQKVQADFEEYMDRLKEDIDLKAERFGHVKYYDAQLRDGYSNEVAVASSEIADMDERRKSLASVNPKLAKDSQLPPEPNVADLTYEHFSLNLNALANSALANLDAGKTVADDEEQEEEGYAPDDELNEVPVNYNDDDDEEVDESEEDEETEEDGEEYDEDSEDEDDDEESEDEEDEEEEQTEQPQNPQYQPQNPQYPQYQPGQQYPQQGQPYQGQQYPQQGQPYQGQQYPPQGQQYQGQPYPQQGQPYQGQPYPPQGQPYQGQPYPPQGQPYQGQPYPPQGQPYQGQQYPPQDQQQGQQYPNYPQYPEV